MTFYIIIGDNDNKDYRKEIRLELDGTTGLLIQDSCRTAEPDDYDAAWNRMCNKISNEHPELPWGWYIYKIE